MVPSYFFSDIISLLILISLVVLVLVLVPLLFLSPSLQGFFHCLACEVKQQVFFLWRGATILKIFSLFDISSELVFTQQGAWSLSRLRADVCLRHVLCGDI